MCPATESRSPGCAGSALWKRLIRGVDRPRSGSHGGGCERTTLCAAPETAPMRGTKMARIDCGGALGNMNRFEELIAKHLDDTATPDDEAELAQLIQTNAEN